jgi:hypothetical protein
MENDGTDSKDIDPIGDINKEGSQQKQSPLKEDVSKLSPSTKEGNHSMVGKGDHPLTLARDNR